MINKYLKFSPFYFFCLYSIIYILFTFLLNYILLDDAIFHKSFDKTIGVDLVTQLIDQQRIYQKFGYGFVPIILLLRGLYTSACLVIGNLFTEQNLKFSQCFNMAIKADIIFLIELIMRIDYFSIFKADSVQEIDVHLFSIVQWVGVDNIEKWQLYPMNVSNIFELIYWILLTLFLSYYTKKSFVNSLGFVTKTYGFGLLLWIAFVMFLVLNFL